MALRRERVGREPERLDERVRREQHVQLVAELRDAVDERRVGGAAPVDVGVVDRHHLVHVVDHEADPAMGSLQDHDLAVVDGTLTRPDVRCEPQRLPQVADRDDLRAQVDHAAHHRRGGGHGAGSGVADDLLHLRDRQAVALRPDGEHHELGHRWPPRVIVNRATRFESCSAERASSVLDADTCCVDALVSSADADACSVAALVSEATAEMPSVASATRAMQPVTPSIDAARRVKASRFCSTVDAADSASFRTSSATTAKPRPCSPARAASISAFSARRLVWAESAAIVSTIDSISLERVARSWIAAPTSREEVWTPDIASNASWAVAAPARAT